MNASSFDHILHKVVIVPIVALLAGAVALVWQINQASQTVALIETCDRRIALTLQMGQLVIDQETGLRGYEITHDPRLLQRYLQAQAAFPAAYERRRALVNNDLRLKELTGFRNAYDTWQQAFATPLIATIQAGGRTDDVELNYRGKLMMDDIRERVAALNAVTIDIRDRAVLRWRRQVRTMIVALVLAAVLLGLVIGLYIRRLIHQISGAFRRSNEILRIRAEQTFRSEEKLRTTLRSIADGVIVCDPEGRVQSVNDMAQELTQWSEDQARDKPLEQIFPIFDETSRQPLENPVARAAGSNHIVHPRNPAILRRPDQTEIFIEDSAAPIRDKHGKLIGAVLVFRDITLAKKSREALIANEKLAVAGRLAATIAHEIHNPLDSVANLLFLMDGVATPEEREHFLRLAQLEIARVTQISRAMLSLYRESKAPVPIDLKEMIASILLLMESRFQTLRVSVREQIPEQLCVHGFPAELRQVFTNLLTNAAEAAGAGGAVVVSARPIPAGTGPDGLPQEAGVEVAIDDNGPGIPEDILPRLFHPFFTTKGERGTGLGLWISRGILTKHGGTLSLASSQHPDDHGTSARVFLALHPTLHASV